MYTLTIAWACYRRDLADFDICQQIGQNIRLLVTQDRLIGLYLLSILFIGKRLESLFQMTQNSASANILGCSKMNRHKKIL